MASLRTCPIAAPTDQGFPSFDIWRAVRVTKSTLIHDQADEQPPFDRGATVLDGWSLGHCGRETPYHHDKYRRPMHAAGIATQIARRGKPHGSGLGKTRWVVERTFAWLHNFRRLRVRFERLALVHEAFMKVACCIICWRQLQKSLC
jgi:transposase